MREYDENIRLYTPILQRIIILVAVIIAVPVVLWTITAFVRGYVAPPQIPTFRPLALAGSTVPAGQQPAPQNSSAIQFAAQSSGATATDARTALFDTKKPGSPQTAPSASAPASGISGVTAPAAQPQQTASAIVDRAAAASSAPTSSSVAAVGTPVVVPPPPFAATRSTPATVAAPPNFALASAGPPQAGTTPPLNPAAIAPIDPSLDAQPASIGAPSAQMAVTDSAAGDLPAGTPLKGKIPMPARRPAVANSTRMTDHVALAAGGVPLPRARPASAPEPAPVVDTPSAYDPSQIH
ncbi:MAG TPA: hypothetical protein VHU22_22830 [Xanthobacteraceae bacterium]|jgi:hypothetical protein|nr:hypothetical protein [Xanthobacteraceae bacterium]